MDEHVATTVNVTIQKLRARENAKRLELLAYHLVHRVSFTHAPTGRHQEHAVVVAGSTTLLQSLLRCKPSGTRTSAESQHIALRIDATIDTARTIAAR